ncbi:glutaredoxin (thioltransferase)-like protein [Camelus ferus]|nr:glutaredoxin (thioltransferase)-like protein [Camelus ferus]
MAQAFVNSKIQPGKVVVFIKPTCPYCRRTQELLSQLPFKQGLLEFVDITATGDTNEIQDYLQQLTGVRTKIHLPLLFFKPSICSAKLLPLCDSQKSFKTQLYRAASCFT